MNKKRVNNWIMTAKDAIIAAKIATKDKNGVYKVDSAFRGQISSFGTAVIMGSFKAAVAFFVKKGEASVNRSALLVAMNYIVNNGEIKSPAEILEYVCENDSKDLKDQFTDAAIALKLALNFFDLGSDEK